MKTILITGSLGLVGSAACSLFDEKGWHVVGVDNNSRNKFFGTVKKYNKYTMDLDFRDMVAVEDQFSETKFDAVVHTGAQPSHDYATDHVLEDFHTNATGTVNLLEGLRHTNSDGIFVYVSTDKVYGENMSAPLFESGTRYELKPWDISYAKNTLSEQGFTEELGLDFAGDRSFFGCSKAAADIYAQQYAARGMKVGIFRPGCITGKNHAGAEFHGMLAYMAKCVREEKTYRIFGNGKNVRDQVHASDIAQAFFEFVQSPKPNAIYNFGGGPERSVSVLEAGELLSKAIGKPFIHEFHEARKGDRKYDVHNISKFRRDYPEWSYEYSLQDIINELAQV